jgi:hypothetical protein
MGRDYLEELGVDVKIIWKCIFRNWTWSVDWLHLTQDRYQRQAWVSLVINVRNTYDTTVFENRSATIQQNGRLARPTERV